MRQSRTRKSAPDNPLDYQVRLVAPESLDYQVRLVAPNALYLFLKKKYANYILQYIISILKLIKTNFIIFLIDKLQYILILISLTNYNPN